MHEDLPIASWKERLLYFLGRRRAFLVEGNSMVPVLNDGDAVLIDPRAKPKIGDIVLADHPFKKDVRVIKRIEDIEADGSVSLAGDNPAESTDSRTLGRFSKQQIIGRAVCRLK